jgi:acyl-coenzyme A thioesterase PaaI-like protein
MACGAAKARFKRRRAEPLLRSIFSVPSLQPNSRSCFVCGVSNPFGLHLKFYIVGPGEVTADVIIPEQYQGYPGIVHGGIVAAMLDEVTGRALMGSGELPRFMYTARLEVRYRKNVPVGRPLHLVGRAGKRGGRSAMASGSICDAEGNILAEADAVLVDVPAGVISTENLEALGWKVYPEEGVEVEE